MPSLESHGEVLRTGTIVTCCGRDAAPRRLHVVAIIVRHRTYWAVTGGRRRCFF